MDWTRLAARFARRKNRLYLDYAAATPLSPSALSRLTTVAKEVYGNASAIHAEGQTAKRILEESRALVGKTLMVPKEEVIFTGSGSESNNLALSGYLESLMASGLELSSCEVVTSAIEHPSLLNVLRLWETRGLTIRYVSIDETGSIAPAALEAALTERTVLVSLGYGNSEVGVVQPVRRLARVVRAKEREYGTRIVFHLDAAQAPLWLPCQPRELDVDLLSLDAGKCNGPKGVGFLIVRSGVTLLPVIRGGGQERGLRAGTEAVPQLAAAAVALAEAQAGRTKRSEKAAAAAAALRVALTTHLSDRVIFNGPAPETGERLPHNVHISLPGVDTEYAVVALDAAGIAASTKSACSGAGGGESAVVRAMTGDPARAASTIRFTIDPALAPRNMERVALALCDHLDLMKGF